MLAFVAAGLVWFLSVNFWQPLFGVLTSIHIPEELRGFIAAVSALMYLGVCAGRVPLNQEHAQTLFGTYTGVSFSAGIYFLPRFPFPILGFILRLFFSEEVNKYSGWVLEGSVSIQSIVVKLLVTGITSDGFRISVSGRLIFEIKFPYVFLSQTKGDTDRTSLIETVEAECAARIKFRVLASHTLKELQRGDNQTGSEKINAWITEVCDLAKEFGVVLVRSPIVEINILSEQVKEVFDQLSAQQIFAENAVAMGLSLQDFQRQHPELSEESAMFYFSQARAAKSGVPRIIIGKIR